MEPRLFSTLSVPAEAQLDAWRGWFDPVFEVIPRQNSSAGFQAASRVWTLGDLVISRVSAPAIRVARSKALIRRNPLDHWVITLGRQDTVIHTRQSPQVMPAGVPFVLSLGCELSSEREQDERLQYYLPRDSFAELAPLLDGAFGVSMATPLGRLLGDYMIMLNRRLPELVPEDLAKLSVAVRAMVQACLAPSPDRLALAAAQIDLSRLEKVRQIVRRQLRAPSLGLNMLCRHVGMSRSQLYRLLECEGGVAQYIRRQRLRESYRLLSDAGNSRTIAQIAEELCFADASSFSRAFRREFGASPRDLRIAGLAGLGTAIRPKGSSQPDTRRFSDCLRLY